MNNPEMGSKGMSGFAIVPRWLPGDGADFENPLAIKITVEGFEAPEEILAALLQFGGQIASQIEQLKPMVDDLPPQGAKFNTVTGEFEEQGHLCDEHAEQLAETLGAAMIADGAEKFLRELNGGMGQF